MNLFSKTASAMFCALRAFFQVKQIPWKYAGEVGPYQLELFSTEHLGEHGRLLAERHRVATEKHPEVLLPRLVDNEKMLALPGFPWVADLLMSFPEGTNEGYGPIFSDSRADRALVC